MQYIIKHFSELTTEELLEIYKLRVSVFVVEQKCPYQEVDDADRDSYHIWFQDEDGIQAYARVMDGGVTFAERPLAESLQENGGADWAAKSFPTAFSLHRSGFMQNKSRLLHRPMPFHFMNRQDFG